MKLGRNDPCSCGSGKKYKNCCLGTADISSSPSLAPRSDEMIQLDRLFSTGRYAELESRALSLLQRHAGAGAVWKLLGLSLQMQGKDALSALKKAALLLPNDAEAHANLAAVLRARGDFGAAVESGRRAVQIRPAFAEAHNNLGVALQDLGKLDDAVASYRRAVQIRPGFAEAHNNLGGALNKLGNLDASRESYQRAIEFKPAFAEAHNNLGVVLQEMGQLEPALACFRKALEIKPDYPDAYYNQGFVLKELGQFDSALASYQRALEIRPDFAEVHNDLGVTLLLLGRFAEGWKEYWWRIPREQRLGFPVIPSPDNPLFDRRPDDLLPASLEGLRIAIVGDQGLGDELFFLRFAGQLKVRGAWLAYAADPRTVSFVRRVNWIDQVVEKGVQVSSCHAVVLASDLPLLLGMATEGDVPPPVPLPVLPEKRKAVSLRLYACLGGAKPLIGVTWRAGGDRLKQQMVREIPVGELAGALSVKQAAFVVVQRNPQPGEVAAFAAAVGQPVIDFSDLNADLEGMLALMEQLDDYVGVDNTNMHLRASVGKGARMLVPHLRDFRSMATGDRSPWFPGFTLYRRTPDGDWSLALRQLMQHLK